MNATNIFPLIYHLTIYLFSNSVYVRESERLTFLQ
jgi:hypothetical protein